jgi:uncharacterized protein (TIGR00251 family)
LPQSADSRELSVRVTPRSSRNAIEVTGESVKVWVTASPTDGQANDAVCRLVAEELGVAAASVTVKRGHKSRDKVLAIQGLDAIEVRRRLFDS